MSRFAIDADLGQALKKSKWTIDSYRLAVDTYRNAESKEQKREMERLITSIKSDFRSEITKDDPKLKRLSKLNGELFNLTNQDSLFEMEKKQKALWTKQIEKLTSEVKKLDAEIEEIKANKIYENAFEWRFEFPEVLNDAGDFVGFDVVIGNPPYGIQIEKSIQQYYSKMFPLSQYKINLYNLFIERMMQLFDRGIIHFIIPKSLMFNSYNEEMRKELLSKTEINSLYTITEKVFEDAEVGSSLMIQITLKKNNNVNNLIKLVLAEKIENFTTGYGLLENFTSQDYFLNLPKCEMSIISNDKKSILEKISTLNKIEDYYTLKNGLNPGNIKDILISDVMLNDNYKKIIWGKELTKYQIVWGGSYINYDESIRSRITLDDIKSKDGMNRQNKIDFALRSKDLFENKKILIRKTGDSLICAIDEENYYFDTLVHGIYKKMDEYELEPLLGILNSKFATNLYRLLHDIKGKVFAKISLENLGTLPIPRLKKQEWETLKQKVNKIQVLTNLKQKDEVNYLTKEIDILIYELYELTSNEIEIIENEL